MSIPASLKYIGLTVLFTMATVNFTRTTLSIVQSSKRLDNIKGEVAGLEIEKQELTDSLAYRNTDAYVEEEARNQLGMVKPGEYIFVAPEGDFSKTYNTDESADTVIVSSNLHRWLNLFF